MIVYKSDKEILAIKKSNQIVAQILSDLSDMVKTGIQTRELDAYAHRKAREMGAIPAFKGEAVTNGGKRVDPGLCDSDATVGHEQPGLLPGSTCPAVPGPRLFHRRGHDGADP